MSESLVSFSLLLISLTLLFGIGVESIVPIPEPDGLESVAPGVETTDAEYIAPANEAIPTSGLPIGNSVTPTGETVDMESFERMGETDPRTSDSVGYSSGKFYFVTCTPPKGRDPKAFYVEILTKIIGSEKAAERALFYDERYGDHFSVRLTTKKAERLERVPEVESVIRERYVLH